MRKHWPLVLFFTLLAPPSWTADVVFSRRVYSQEGRTYAQIWTADPRTHRLVPLTNTPRRHDQPVCTPDGIHIWFLSGAFGNEKNTELWLLDRHTRTEKLALQFSGSFARLLGGTEKQALFTAYQGETPALFRWDGSLTKLSPSAPSAFDSVALSPDGRSLAVQSSDSEAVVMMETGGALGRKVDHCAGPAWSPDGRKLACTSGRTIRIVNLTTGVETGHAEFAQRTTEPRIADYSPDGTRLLVKTVGANQSSTSPQSDYWTFDLGTGKWMFVGPGQSAIFSPGGGVLLVTPRELTTVGKAHDWVSQLLAADPTTHAETPLTTGITSNTDPCRCKSPALVPPPAVKKKPLRPARRK